MQYQYIDEQHQLNQLCSLLAKAPVLTVDTEFVRTRTLYAKLGLLQVCDGKQLALIDPIAINDLSAFWQLLTNKKITKVLHACSEDLEVFLTTGQCKPENLIDSQIMMSFLGHGLSIGYAAMVKHFIGVELDKSESRTNWTKRPLSAKQLTYAGADVDYLFSLYPKLLAEVEQAGFLDFVKQESQALIEKKFTAIDENSLYLNVKMAWKLNPKQLNRLKHLARWRYNQAKKRDLPIGFIAKDPTLIALAQHNPQGIATMNQIEGVELLDIRHHGKAMLAILTCSELEGIEQYPSKIIRLDEYPGYKKTFKKVRDFIALASEEHQLAVENLASKKQVNQFLSWYFDLNNARNELESVDLLTGWRYQLFGQSLLDFANKGFA